jgi:hypothetical protein
MRLLGGELTRARCRFRAIGVPARHIYFIWLKTFCQTEQGRVTSPPGEVLFSKLGAGRRGRECCGRGVA